MPSFEKGDVVRVPFPYTDRATKQRRPALVVSNGPIGEDGRLLWVAMITSAENRPWSDDVAIGLHEHAGLPAPSVVRPCKIATIEARDAEVLGRIDAASLAAIDEIMANLLGLPARLPTPGRP